MNGKFPKVGIEAKVFFGRLDMTCLPVGKSQGAL